ncbi:MAG: bifunctional riboflavin kinase/FAD synthetase [Flammeovirgaceae bacterium]|nr:bifunctional riboflavin kinase/FAD synthetase [Flammeovirgaceae bacterium]
MKIYYHIDDFIKLDNAVVTSGTFDGVHIGHQKILHRLKEIAAKSNGETVVITFWPHPRLVLYPGDSSLKLLNTFEEKADLLKAEGIQHLLRIPFTKEFSQIHSNEFIRNILVDCIGTKKLVIGYDHRFGKNREGSFEDLKKNSSGYGFSVEEIPKQEVDQVGVSSTKIRQALLDGEVEIAAQFIGRPYSLSGRVIKGERLGRMMGFPTANIDVDAHNKLIPSEGIYAVKVQHAELIFKGMLYIGNRPTLNGTSRSIEVNIFDFDYEIYGETLKIDFIQRIRKDIKFQDIEALKNQLQEDKKVALEILVG